MVKRNYNFDFSAVNPKRSARAILANQPVSLKYSVELCRELKGKSVKNAEAFLNDLKEMRAFLPLRKYRKKVPHRRGEPKSKAKAGRYPIKAAAKFLDLLKLVKANADVKGLDAGKLRIAHLFASQGFHRRGMQAQGRISGKQRKRKSTHLEIVVQEAGQ